MMMISRFALFVAWLVVFVSPVNAEDSWQIARRIPAEFHAALEKGDRNAALALLADNVRIYEQGWVENSKADYAEHHLDSDIRFSQTTKSEVTAHSELLGYDICFFTREVHTTGTFEGKPVDTITLETMILRASFDDWKIVHIHWSSRKAK